MQDHNNKAPDDELVTVDLLVANMLGYRSMRVGNAELANKASEVEITALEIH